MKFSLHSETQYWGGKTWSQMYDEVLEQVVNADRLGYDAYAIVEHFFFPKFSISPDPVAFFTACAQRTKRITFRTLVHILPYHNPTALTSRIAAACACRLRWSVISPGWSRRQAYIVRACQSMPPQNVCGLV